MNLKKIIFSIAINSIIFVSIAQAQDFAKTRQFNLNESGTNYFKISGMVQAWVRNMNYNPGSTVFGYPKSNGVDIGIRRYRVVMYGQLTDRVFFYGHFGENNFNSISDRKLGFFVHDAYGEYALDKTKFSLGVGLSGWNGLSRFSSSSTSSVLGLDLPLFLEATNDVTDQFGRKLSVYTKGKLGKLDYRVSLAQPMAIQKSSTYNPANNIGVNSSFSAEPTNLQCNGYFMYQFKDEESNLTPYATGTYLGKKTVFNIGAGFIYQKNAMWRLQNAADPTSILKSNMNHFSGDIYYDAPVGSKGESISAYGNYTHYDFGQNYLRNTGPMNPATGNSDTSVLNGAGNAFPAYGTGDVFYVQVGYKFQENLIGKTTLMPYASIQHANYDRLSQTMNYYDMGVNWLLAGHTSKLTLAYQNRPVYNTVGDLTTHKNAVVAQYQVSF